jgi:hypothetical protein
MSKDMKNSFYRTLNLDREGKLALKWFREHVRSIKNDAEKKIITIKDEESND